MKKEKHGKTAADNKLARNVESQLHAHKEIDTSKVTIQVQTHKVKLSGEVDNAHAKNLSKSIALQEVSDVEEVDSDQLECRRDNHEPPAGQQ